MFSNAILWVSAKQYSMKKALGQTQTLCTGCSKAEPKFFVPPQTPASGGAGRPKFNQLQMVTTFTCKPSLVKIDARNFELSWSQTHKATTHNARPLQTDRTDNNNYYTAPLSLALSVMNCNVLLHSEQYL